MKVTFVCWGNICRSPMAERIARAALAEAGLTDVEVDSSATSRDELGEPMDPRAARALRSAGYDADGHRARQATRADVLEADLVVAMEDIHVARLRDLSGRDDADIVLLTSFDPDAEPGSGVPDPWYGEEQGFADTLAAIERAMPGFIRRVRAQNTA